MAQAADFEKSPDRTRLNNLFQLMDKSLSRMGKKAATEDLHQVRYASSKLLQIVSAQDKVHRDLVFKQPGLVDILVSVLQQVSDEQALLNTVKIFNELLGRSQGGRRPSMLVSHGVTLVIFQILKQVVCQEITLSEEMQLLCHSVLSKIGHKDRKFGVKARLHRTLLLTLNLIKNNLSHFSYLQPLLLVLKLYTANSGYGSGQQGQGDNQQGGGNFGYSGGYGDNQQGGYGGPQGGYGSPPGGYGGQQGNFGGSQANGPGSDGNQGMGGGYQQRQAPGNTGGGGGRGGGSQNFHPYSR